MFERGMVTTKYPMQYVKVDLKELSSIADYLNKIDPKNRAKICADGLMTVSDVYRDRARKPADLAVGSSRVGLFFHSR